MGKEQEVRPCPFCSRRLIMKDPVLRKWVHPLETLDDVDCAGSAIEVSDNPVRIAAWNRRDEQAEVVAWRVKDFADGWILFHTEAEARREASGAGNLVQGLAVAHPSPAVAAGGVTEEMVEAMWQRLEPLDFNRDDLRSALTAALAVRDEGMREGDK